MRGSVIKLLLQRFRFVPKGKIVVLRLVSSKHGQIEKQDDCLRRIVEAAQYVPYEQLALSPQCGFASHYPTVG